MKTPLTKLKRFAGNCSGASAIEYSLIAGLICIVLIGSITSVGISTSDVFTSVSVQGFNQQGFNQ
jgi:pilus assembly protein Flp/PilA